METRSLSGTSLRCLIALAVALGAYLLFELEPLAGKIITPRFGGTAGTWSVCLLFFQLIVLAGYTATWLIAKLKPTRQVIIYATMAATTLVFSRIPLPAQWIHGTGDPGQEVLLLLLKNIAAPALFLSSLSGTMQVWYRRSGLGDPYPLYAVSNIGSIVALFAYPLLIEPNFTVGATLEWWSFGYWSVIALVLVISWPANRKAHQPGFSSVMEPAVEQAAPASPQNHEHAVNILTEKDHRPVDANQIEGAQKPEQSQTTSTTGNSHSAKEETQCEGNRDVTNTTSAAADVPWWITLSTAGSLTLMSYTSYITSDIAPVPLLWVLPLALYLLSFILAFAGRKFYRQVIFTHIWPYIAWLEFTLGSVRPNLRLGLSLLQVFLMCMVCHGELAVSRPHPDRLPLFYLCISLGGVIAGIFAALIAPSVFDFEPERYLALALVLYITILAINFRRLYVLNLKVSMVLIALPAVSLLLLGLAVLDPENMIYRKRNFYSAVMVLKEDNKMKLIHGRILHGEQSLNPAEAGLPSTYYKAPVKLMFDFLRSQLPNKPLNLCVVGLGTGAIASYGATGDHLTFYELDPKIKDIASTWFTYLRITKARAEVRLGDGRATLESLPNQAYDFMFIDAFNGDAVPIHLLTKEAMEIYKKHLNADGLLIFHVTNKYVKLPHPIADTARACGLFPILVKTKKPLFHYVVLARDQSIISKFYGYACENHDKYEGVELIELAPSEKVWTDDFANIFSTLRLY